MSPGAIFDLLVDVGPDFDVLDLIDGAAQVEEIVGVGVDIVTSRSLRIDHEIVRSAVPL